MLGRMIALAGGDEGLARIVMPLLSDTLASQTSGADAEVGARGSSLRLLSGLSLQTQQPKIAL